MTDVLTYLRSPQAVRERSHILFAAAEEGKLLHWNLHLEKLPTVVALVEDETAANYPNGDVPYHSRWRHFDEQRLAALREKTAGMPEDDALRTMTGLIIVSVLLDAGAGMGWRYLDPLSGESIGRSEGLARASFDWYLAGGLSSDGQTPRADQNRLADLTERDLRQAFQVTESNPLVGIDGRLALLHSLAKCMQKAPRDFGGSTNLGSFADILLPRNEKATATYVLQRVLQTFADIWPGRFEHEGENLGDAWHHPLLGSLPVAAGIIPFHKLSQWLTYSLVETLERAGHNIADVDQLTGLPEYRNGGLFFDAGVISLKSPSEADKTWQAKDPLIVEWRALTVALLDKTGDALRKQRGLSAADLPLVKVLQGGTWSAGRKLAADKRTDGGPPLHIKSDGTVF